MRSATTFDVAVIGAGVFGAWTALHLARRGLRVVLVEAYGPAHSRASSGGETRIIRMSYGADEIYTRWSRRSLVQWKELFAAQKETLFHQTGALWLAGADQTRVRQSESTLQRYGVTHEVMDAAALETRYPQMNLAGITRGVLEPESGVLLARRAVACTVRAAIERGGQWKLARALTPRGRASLDSIALESGERISAGQFVFACGPWLGKVFPDLLGPRIFPTRQEVFFFGCPAGDGRLAPPSLPTWLFETDEVYGMPDIEGRGLKLARDTHGELIDPDTQSRQVSREGIDWAHSYVAKRFPAMKDARIVEARVCQYENTSNGDFLLDRHPEMANVWLAGGGSGHGFKHGPAVGEYLAGRVCGEGDSEPRFSLSTKETRQARMVH